MSALLNSLFAAFGEAATVQDAVLEEYRARVTALTTRCETAERGCRTLRLELDEARAQLAARAEDWAAGEAYEERHRDELTCAEELPWGDR